MGTYCRVPRFWLITIYIYIYIIFFLHCTQEIPSNSGKMGEFWTCLEEDPRKWGDIEFCGGFSWCFGWILRNIHHMERVTCQQGSCWHDWDAIGRDDCKPEGDSTSGTIIWDDGWWIRITRRNLHLWGWTRTTSIESRQFWETTPPILDGTNSGSDSVGKSSGSLVCSFGV